jgi:hypothetical protein
LAPASAPGGDLVAMLWQAYLRRFDIEHTFRFLKQQPGWNRPLLRDPQAADLWTWLVIAASAQLQIARRGAGTKTRSRSPRKNSQGDPQPSGRILFEDFRRVTLARR